MVPTKFVLHHTIFMFTKKIHWLSHANDIINLQLSLVRWTKSHLAIVGSSLFNCPCRRQWEFARNNKSNEKERALSLRRVAVERRRWELPVFSHSFIRVPLVYLQQNPHKRRERIKQGVESGSGEKEWTASERWVDGGDEVVSGGGIEQNGGGSKTLLADRRRWKRTTTQSRPARAEPRATLSLCYTMQPILNRLVVHVQFFSNA